MGVRSRCRLYRDPPGLVAASYLPGGELADALHGAEGRSAKTRICLSFLARVRLAPLYVLIVIGVNVILNHAVSAEVRTQIVLANSTNVANLQDHRFWTLVTSAFVLDERVGVVALVPLLLLLSVAEVLWGWRRLLVVFFGSNAVTSCLVYGLLLAGVRGGWLGGAITVASDVGTSYGSHAVAGALALTLPVRARRYLVPLAIAVVVLPFLNGGTFTDVGHLLAVLLGFLAGWQMRRRPLAGRLRRPALLRADQTMAYSFDDVTGARAALITALRQHRPVRLDDAVVAWSDQADRIHVQETRDMDAIDGTLAGGAWGVVLGTFVGLPITGLVIGAGAVAVVARRHDAGLSDTTVERTMQALPTGSSALLLLLLADPAGRPALTRALTRTGGTPVPDVAQS